MVIFGSDVAGESCMGETAILARKFLPNSCSAGAGAGWGMPSKWEILCKIPAD
jgi:hypothetical protein